MTPDALPQEQPRETASLTMVRVQRRRSSLQPSRNKAGDLTAKLMEAKPSAIATAPVTAAPEPALPPITAAPIAPAPTQTPLDDQTIAPPPLSLAEVIALPPAVPGEPAETQESASIVEVTLAAEPDFFAEVPADPPPVPPEEPVAATAPTAEPAPTPPAVAPPGSADALIDYWDELAGDRLFPAFAELDRPRIAQYWPNSVLLTLGGDMPRMTRLGEPDGEIEYNLMVTDWILSRGRQAAERAEALEEEQRFPMGRDRVRYRLVLLPCSDAGERVDHMLCHLSRIAEPKLTAVGAFKRWLAS